MAVRAGPMAEQLQPAVHSEWDDDWDRDIPQPPENFPQDQELRDAVIAAVQEPEAAKELAKMMPIQESDPDSEPETHQDAQQAVEIAAQVPLVDRRYQPGKSCYRITNLYCRTYGSHRRRQCQYSHHHTATNRRQRQG